jgi:hypothetical protein
MNSIELTSRLRSSIQDANQDAMPLPGGGNTWERHRRLMEIGREDLSLARLAEAHWDAVAILAEAGRSPAPNALYGVWASEIPGCVLQFDAGAGVITGEKWFCSGAQILDRALITVGSPEPLLVEVDLRKHSDFLHYDPSAWKTNAFAETHTYTAYFEGVPASLDNVIGDRGWYLRRPGFWHGACGPAACWAGGAIGLVDYAVKQSRGDAHTLAHLGAMQATVWAFRAYLAVAGDEIDAEPYAGGCAQRRALTVRHLIEQGCTDILRRVPRAYGPRPLAMDESIAQRYQELDLYLRQSHAERDLESLGRLFREK